MEDEDEVRMPLCAWAVFRVGRTFSSLGIVGIAGKFKTKRACGIRTACHSCSK